MDSVIVPAVLGLFISVLGILNMKGNISSIHRYHRHRVTAENVRLFGKLMGLGTLIAGVSIIVFAIFSFAAQKTQNEIFLIAGTVIMLPAIAAGIGISIIAMLKYNRGIF